MEINLENAFLVILKISMGPLLPTVNTISEKIQEASIKLLINILKKPAPSTLLFVCMLMILMGLLTISIITMGAVLCAVVAIVIFEGFIFGVILILAGVITIITMGFLIILLGLKSTNGRKLV